MTYGYQLAEDGQTLVHDAAEQATLALMRLLRDQRQSIRQITRKLNALGLRSRRGSDWRHQRVAKLLSSLTAAASVNGTTSALTA